MARLQAAGRGRLLVMILLALFLLAVAPAQAARFTRGLRARIGEAPALEAAQVSAEENWRSNAVVQEMFGRMALQIPSGRIAKGCSMQDAWEKMLNAVELRQAAQRQ